MISLDHPGDHEYQQNKCGRALTNWFIEANAPTNTVNNLHFHHLLRKLRIEASLFRFFISSLAFFSAAALFLVPLPLPPLAPAPLAPARLIAIMETASPSSLELESESESSAGAGGFEDGFEEGLVDVEAEELGEAEGVGVGLAAGGRAMGNLRAGAAREAGMGNLRAGVEALEARAAAEEGCEMVGVDEVFWESADAVLVGIEVDLASLETEGLLVDEVAGVEVDAGLSLMLVLRLDCDWG
jgi:hypothetical protein